MRIGVKWGTGEILPCAHVVGFRASRKWHDARILAHPFSSRPNCADADVRHRRTHHVFRERISRSTVFDHGGIFVSDPAWSFSFFEAALASLGIIVRKCQ